MQRQGHVGMAQSCTKGGLDWTLENFDLPKEFGQTLEQLPREVFNATSLTLFKRPLDNAHNNLLYFGQP